MRNYLFHEGERRVQTHAGVTKMADQVKVGIRDFIQPAAMVWLENQVLAAAASRSEDGVMWASLLTGAPGFLRVEGENSLGIQADLSAEEPLREALARGNAALGVIVLEPATRRRLRLNGVGELTPQGLRLVANEIYGNCPKYIQTRRPIASPTISAPAVTTGQRLSDSQCASIGSADTFFMATAHPQHGADCSHRGGLPGFVRVLSDSRLEFDDYAGNAMFNTLGNLEIDPHCGLVFLNWESGATLQLSGKAHVRWEGESRSVEFKVEQWRETQNATSLHWQFGEYSPFNPQ